MSKISQLDLLNEGFWDKFNPSPVIRQGVEAIKQFGSVVAPEFSDPIRKGAEKMRDISKNIKRAGRTRDEIVKEQIIENGFHPFQKSGQPDANVKWGKKNTDGTLTGSIKVGELGYTDDGNPYMAAEFENVLKSDVIFRYDPVTKDIKIVRAPYRQARVTKPMGGTPNTSQNSQQNPTP